jgi:ketosteroid isomerase-like protein
VSRLFGGLETASGPQRVRKGIAKGPQLTASGCGTITVMGVSLEIELVGRAWDALIAGGPEVLGEVLAPDAQWYGVEDGQLCDGRETIIEVMSRNLAGRLRGTVEETVQDGPRVIVAFRPEQPARLDRPVDDGIAYMVVTIRDGHIVEMKGCADRSAAVSYAHERTAPP